MTAAVFYIVRICVVCERNGGAAVDFIQTTEESRRRWERNAAFWDEYMGQDSNYFHRDLVRPGTEELLQVREGDFVLDIACGNGNFSQRLVDLGARVVAFDYSETMIACAKRRRTGYPDRIEFLVMDATDEKQLASLRRDRPYDKAVANMAVMDLAAVEPLLRAVYALLQPGGCFVFSTHQPCFVRPEGQYLTPCVHEGEAVGGQPVLHYYYHRPLRDLFGACFAAGFVMDAFQEVPDKVREEPEIMIVRLRKPEGTRL